MDLVLIKTKVNNSKRQNIKQTDYIIGEAMAVKSR